MAHCETSRSQAALEQARMSAVAQACSSCEAKQIHLIKNKEIGILFSKEFGSHSLQFRLETQGPDTRP